MDLVETLFSDPRIQELEKPPAGTPAERLEFLDRATAYQKSVSEAIAPFRDLFQGIEALVRK